MFPEFHQAVRAIFESAQKDGRLTRNPTNEELRSFVKEEPGVRVTKYDNIVADSEPMSRAAMFTRNNVDTTFGGEEHQLLEQAKQCSAREPLVSIDVVVGDGSEGVTARLMLPKRFAHVAYAGMKLFRPTVTEEPTYQVVMFFDDELEQNND